MLYYSYKKPNEVVAKGHFNNQIVPGCEFKPYLVHSEKKIRYH